MKLENEVLKIVTAKELEDLCTTYRLWRVKEPSKKVNLVNLFKRLKSSARKRNGLIALLGGAPALHAYLGRTADLDSLATLLEEAIEAQRADLPKMAHRDRNDLIKMLLEFKREAPKEAAPVNVSFNMDRFLAENDAKVIQNIVDAEENEKYQ